MTPADRLLLEAVSRRADKVKILVDLMLRTDNYRAPVLARSAGVLVRTFFVLCGDDMRNDLLQWMVRSLQDRHGICYCGAAKTKPSDPACAACEDEFSRTDREAELLEKMEQPVKGPVS